jgi:acetyl esterase/lipase
MRKISLALLAMALLSAAGNAAPQRDFAVSEKPALTDVYPDRITKWTGGVTSHADVVYSSPSGFRPLVVDIYMPPKKGGAKPLVLYIHGGGWVAGHTRHSGALANFPAVLAKLASEGFVVASLEYRLAGETGFPAQLQDSRAAIRFLKANAAKYGIDPAKVGVWGGSAGGHLSALTAYSCGDTSLDPASAPAGSATPAAAGSATPAPAGSATPAAAGSATPAAAGSATPAPAGSECVQSLVSWYGVFDFAAMINRPLPSSGQVSPENQLLRCKPVDCDPARIAAVSPVSYIDANDPPSLLIHGEKDAVVDVSQSRIAEARLKAAGASVESIYIPGVDHSFIGATYAETKAATLQATNATFDFFHKTLKAKSK